MLNVQNTEYLYSLQSLAFKASFNLSCMMFYSKSTVLNQILAHHLPTSLIKSLYLLRLALG